MASAWVCSESSHFSPVHCWSWLTVLQDMGGTNLLGTSIILQTSDDPEPALALRNSDTSCNTNGGPCAWMQPHLAACYKSRHLSPWSLLNLTVFSTCYQVACLEATRIWWALGGFSGQHYPHFCGNDYRELPVCWPHGDTGQGRSLLLNRHWFNKQISELWIITHLHLGY